MSVSKLFEGAISSVYATSRPTLSAVAVKQILQFLEEKRPKSTWKLAIDACCGTGLSTEPFVTHFPQIIGLDTSETQIAEGNKLNRQSHVQFKVGSAYEMPCEPSTVDLIVCVSAAHWLEPNKFFDECHRVLAPGGVIALAAYGLFHLEYPSHPERNGELNDVVREFYDKLLVGGYWDKRRSILEGQYADIHLPYEDNRIFRNDPSLYLHKTVPFPVLIDYFNSWSSVHTYLKKHPGGDLLQKFEQKLTETLKDDNPQVTTIFPWFLLLSRKPVDP